MPFTLSNVFSGAFSSIRKGFVPLLIVTLALYIVPNLIVTFGLRLGLGVTFGTAQSFQGGMLGVSIASGLVMYALTFLHISAASEVCLLTAAGKPVKLSEVFAHALGNAFPIFLIYLLCGLGWIVGSILLFVPGFIFGTIFSIVIPAYVAEKPGVFGAFSRSQALTKGHRWGIFGLWLLVMIIFYVVMAAIEVPVLMPVLRESMKAAQMGRQAVPPVPSLGATAAITVAFSLVWVVVLAINASVYGALRAEKDKFSGASLEKVFE